MSESPVPDSSTSPGARRWVRILLPAVLILVWLVGAAIGGTFFGRVGEVASNEQAHYLPSSSDAAKVQAMLGEFSNSDAMPSIVVFTSETALTKEQVDAVNAQVAELPTVAGVADSVSPAVRGRGDPGAVRSIRGLPGGTAQPPGQVGGHQAGVARLR